MCFVGAWSTHRLHKAERCPMHMAGTWPAHDGTWQHNVDNVDDDNVDNVGDVDNVDNVDNVDDDVNVDNVYDISNV